MDNNFFLRFLSSIILLPIILFLIYKGTFYFNFFLILILSITFKEWYSMTKNYYFFLIPGIIFLLLSFYSIYQIRTFDDLYIFYYILFISIFTDIGGYFFGKFFKGPKLSQISPNKTYSGSLGGLIFSFIFLFFFFKFNNLQLTFYYILITFILSIVSQIGDLIISFFKRKSKFKDTGKIIPGHGGMLDRIDGMIFVYPFYYYCL